MTDGGVVDLTRISSEDLRAELERRKRAAQAKGRPMKFATKAEWAEARVAEICAQLAEIRGRYQEGPAGLRKKQDEERALQAELRKFERLAATYRRQGI